MVVDLYELIIQFLSFQDQTSECKKNYGKYALILPAAFVLENTQSGILFSKNCHGGFCKKPKPICIFSLYSGAALSRGVMFRLTSSIL